jgi:transposase
MNTIYYIGLDIHKKTIAYCIKKVDGIIVDQGTVAAERQAVSRWLSELPGPWYGAMEATIFTGWVYDFLKPHAVDLKVAHPAMLKAITAAKKKNDRADAEKIADLLRVSLLPECHMKDFRNLLAHEYFGVDWRLFGIPFSTIYRC